MQTKGETKVDTREREYDRIHNEGGEGYNPYRAEREERVAKKLAALAAQHAQTTQGNIDALYRRIDVECGSVAREWGNGAAIDALETDLYRQITELKAQQDAEFLAVWTAEVTQERRAGWNSMVTSGKFGKLGGQMDFLALRNQERAQGWTMDDLKKAIKLNGL